jgi:hypothetical protein
MNSNEYFEFKEWLDKKSDEAWEKLFDEDGFMIAPKNWNRKATIHNELNYIKEGVRAMGRLIYFILFGYK